MTPEELSKLPHYDYYTNMKAAHPDASDQLCRAFADAMKGYLYGTQEALDAFAWFWKGWARSSGARSVQTEELRTSTHGDAMTKAGDAGHRMTLKDMEELAHTISADNDGLWLGDWSDDCLGHIAGYIGRLEAACENLRDQRATSETLWLLERKDPTDPDRMRHIFWAGSPRWTANALEAVRFPSKPLAELAVTGNWSPSEREDEPVYVCEHIFGCGTEAMLSPRTRTMADDIGEMIEKGAPGDSQTNR